MTDEIYRIKGLAPDHPAQKGFNAYMQKRVLNDKGFVTRRQIKGFTDSRKGFVTRRQIKGFTDSRKGIKKRWDDLFLPKDELLRRLDKWENDRGAYILSKRERQELKNSILSGEMD